MEPDTWDVYYDPKTGEFYAQSGPSGDIVLLDIKHEDEDGYGYEPIEGWFHVVNVNLSELPKEPDMAAALMVGVVIDTEEKFSALMKHLGLPNTRKKE